MNVLAVNLAGAKNLSFREVGAKLPEQSDKHFALLTLNLAPCTLNHDANRVGIVISSVEGVEVADMLADAAFLTDVDGVTDDSFTADDIVESEVSVVATTSSTNRNLIICLMDDDILNATHIYKV